MSRYFSSAYFSLSNKGTSHTTAQRAVKKSYEPTFLLLKSVQSCRAQLCIDAQDAYNYTAYLSLGNAVECKML